MKKIVIILCFLLVGCANHISIEKKDYLKYLQMIETSNQFADNLPCDINVYLDKLTNDEIMYRIVVDNPKESMYDVRIVVSHNQKTTDIFPSSGIFEKKLNLIPHDIDLNNNKVKGIILIGYISFMDEINQFKGQFKGIIVYKNEMGKEKTWYFNRQI